MRIRLWDTAYEAFGILLSETQTQAREELLQHLNRYYRVHGLDKYCPSDTAVPAHDTWATKRLFDYSLALKDTGLTPVQAQLRLKLEAVARTLEPRFRWIQNDEGEMCIQREDDWAYELLDSEFNKSHENNEKAEIEEESKELAEGDSEEMRCFRILFR